jgi:multidrug transporter EmrE-like cation transporter
MTVYVFLGLAFLCNAGANVLLKLGATHDFSIASLLRGDFNLAHLYTGSAVFLFGANLAFYLLALKTIPLSVAYPVMVGMTFFITTGASVLLGEHLSLIHLLGITMIIAGMLIILQFAQT